MRTLDGVQVFTLSEVIVGDLMTRQPSEVISEVKEWCQQNDAVYGVGEDELSLIEAAVRDGKRKVVIAEV
jgi:SH3-like domain-containing protein